MATRCHKQGDRAEAGEVPMSHVGGEDHGGDPVQ